MLGPFFDRDGNVVTREEVDELFRTALYSHIATDVFTTKRDSVQTRWKGHDEEQTIPPRIFLSRTDGDPDVPEVTSATEEEALRIHASICDRYRDQDRLVDAGGAPLLSRGVL